MLNSLKIKLKTWVADKTAALYKNQKKIMADTQVTPEEKIAALETTIKQQEETIVELNEVNAQLEKTIEEQELLLNKNDGKSLPAVKKKVGIPSESFKVDGEEHVFTVPQFTNPLDKHSVITAEEALTNKDLLAYLVKNNTGITKRKEA